MCIKARAKIAWNSLFMNSKVFWNICERRIILNIKIKFDGLKISFNTPYNLPRENESEKKNCLFVISIIHYKAYTKGTLLPKLQTKNPLSLF